ncbi:MAG TPA: type II toxin-antitoxin system prevent-host-death family antitoxin [Geminicoccaceae bacterium]|jgi:prevent-host-death family protein|nr:type II toxin-antitoxin system prevent-host-death family antitoxin [Geminicoccaceae bacterium]
MNVVTAYEAKTNLARLLERVGRGERITITRHGVPVAELVPARGKPAQDVRATIEALRELRRGQRLDGIPLKELIEEGRR